MTVDKPGSGTCHPRRAFRGNLVLPAPLRQKAGHAGQITVNVQTCKFVLDLPRLLPWLAGEPTLRCHGRRHLPCTSAVQ